MAIKQSSGYVGLGSRLFMGVEGVWGTKNNGNWLGTSIYNQAGSRPQKVTSPIEVSQLYPSMLRRKPIKNTVTVEGSYTFSLPTSGSADFWKLITGDTASGAGPSETSAQEGTLSLPSAVGNGDRVTGDISITGLGTGSIADFTVGAKAKIVNFDSGSAFMDDSNENPDYLFTISSVNDGTDTISFDITPESFGDAVMTPTVLAGQTVDAQAIKVLNGFIQFEVTFTNTDNLVIKSLDISKITGTNAGHGTSGVYAQLEKTIAELTNNYSVANGNVTSISYAGANTVLVTTNIETDRADGTLDTDIFNADGTDIVVEGYDIVGLKAVADTNIQVIEMEGAGGSYELQEIVGTSYSFVQTISDSQLSVYTGMMGQSATFNITPDDLANVEVSFLGKNEEIYDVTAPNVATVFGGSVDDYVKLDGNKITGSGSTYDGCVEFYPSWSAKLLVNRKVDNGDAWKYQVPNTTISNLVGNDGSGVGNRWQDSSASSGGTFDTTDNAVIPFSDLSITVNNNLEFPAYINGTKERNKPVQTTYKEVTGSITVPYNDFTRDFVRSMFDQDSFEFRIVFELQAGDLGEGSSASTITLKLPEVCIAGDSLADIPEGEMTLPINFVAYAPKKATGIYETASSLAPFAIELGGSQS